MLSIVDPQMVDNLEQEKQVILNKIIAAGINSLTPAVVGSNSSNERQLLDSFISQSFDKILSVWPMLDERIKFYIFKANISEFENYMKQKIGESR